jgi:heme-degrading monooxygenase HmoA
MEAMAAAQPGYLGHESARDGIGITVSYWTDEASACAWYRHPDHAAIRNAGRGRWYSDFTVHVAQIARSYAWARPETAEDAA